MGFNGQHRTCKYVPLAALASTGSVLLRGLLGFVAGKTMIEISSTSKVYLYAEHYNAIMGRKLWGVEGRIREFQQNQVIYIWDITFTFSDYFYISHKETHLHHNLNLNLKT